MIKQNKSVSYANSFDLQKPQPQLNTVHDVVSDWCTEYIYIPNPPAANLLVATCWCKSTLRPSLDNRG